MLRPRVKANSLSRTKPEISDVRRGFRWDPIVRATIFTILLSNRFKRRIRFASYREQRNGTNSKGNVIQLFHGYDRSLFDRYLKRIGEAGHLPLPFRHHYRCPDRPLPAPIFTNLATSSAAATATLASTACPYHHL